MEYQPRAQCLGVRGKQEAAKCLEQAHALGRRQINFLWGDRFEEFREARAERLVIKERDGTTQAVGAAWAWACF
jgi:hypothetical protein